MKNSLTGNVLWQRTKQLIQLFWKKMSRITMRLFLLGRLLSKKEKIVLWSTFLLLIAMLVVKSVSYYWSLTRVVPAVGGVYSEGMVGQPEFINPILATSENDKTVDSLIYQGLVSLDNKNQATPELASSYDISTDQKSYTFNLRPGVLWQDGNPFTAKDVVYTFNQIKDPASKSPYYDNFKDVLVESPDASTIKLSLKTPYGPFLTNLDVGIVEQGTDLSQLNNHPVGTGEYSYLNSTSSGGKVQSLVLERNESYWGEKPYLKRVEFKYFDSASQVENIFEQEDLSAISADSKRVNIRKLTYQTPATINLIFNLRAAPFNDVNLRKAIQTGQKSPKGFSFDLLVADSPELVQAADGFKNKIAPLGYKANVKVLKENDLKDEISKKTFQALVVGIDFGHDFDPYSLWHSSAEATGMNLAGFMDKNADILLEDARVLNDPVARQTKYDQFFKILDDQAVQIVLEKKSYTLSIDNKFKDVSVSTSLTPAEHLRDISKWYLDTKRVKK
jgi:ABC-type transport system substrate-binding protein